MLPTNFFITGSKCSLSKRYDERDFEFWSSMCWPRTSTGFLNGSKYSLQKRHYKAACYFVLAYVCRPICTLIIVSTRLAFSTIVSSMYSGMHLISGRFDICLMEVFSHVFSCCHFRNIIDDITDNYSKIGPLCWRLHLLQKFILDEHEYCRTLHDRWRNCQIQYTRILCSRYSTITLPAEYHSGKIFIL